MADNTFIVSPTGNRALLSWQEVERSIRQKNPMIAPEQLDKAKQAWTAAARKETGIEAPPAPAPGPSGGAPPSRDPTRPGDVAGATRAGQELNPPPPPAPPGGPGLIRRGAEAVFGAGGPGPASVRNMIDPGLYAASEAYRTIKRPYEEIGAELTGAIRRGSLQTGREGHRTRDAAYRALRAMGVSEETAKHRAHQAERLVKETVAPLAGGIVEYTPEMTALGEVAEGIPLLQRGERFIEQVGPKVVPEAVKRITPRLAPTIGKAVASIPRSIVSGAGIGGATRFAQGEIGERDPRTGKVIPPATGEDISAAAREGASGFTQAELAARGLGYVLGAPFRVARRGMPDWFEGSTNRPRTENQATPDHPTPPVRDETQPDPAFVKELNQEPTPPTAGKKEPAAPGLAAQNERTDKAGSGAGGTDPDDPGTHPQGGGPTSPSVPPGVAPGDIRESDAVRPAAPGPGTSEQFKPRQAGPIREHFKQVEADRIAAQRAADDAAHTAEVGARRLEAEPRNIEEYRRQLRGEPAEEPAAPLSRAERQGLPRTLMDYLRNPRGYAETRAAAPAGATRARVTRPVTGDAFARLVRQLRGEEPEAQPGPPLVPEERGWPQALIDQQRRDREAEEASRQTQVEKERQAAAQAETEQRIRNRQEREAAMPPMRILQHLARDRERNALAALAGIERPGVEWAGPVPSRERPYEGEGWRWPEEPPKGKRPPKEPESRPLHPEMPQEEPGETFDEDAAAMGEALREEPDQEELQRAREDEERRARRAEAERAAEEEAARKREPPPPPDAEQLQRVVSQAADQFRGARPKDKGHFRRELRGAARALAEMMTPEAAGKFIREEIGNGPITSALDDILGEHLKRPKTAAPGGRPGRGKPEAAKPTTTSVLPEKPRFAIRLTDGRVLSDPAANSHAEVLTKWGKPADEVASTGFVDPDGTYRAEPGTKGFQKKTAEAEKPEKAAIFAVRTKDGSVWEDPDADFHVDVMIAHDLDPDEIKDTGFILKSGQFAGKYKPGNPVWNDAGEMIDVKVMTPGKVVQPEDIRSWKDEMELRRKELEGEEEELPEGAIRGRSGTLHVEGFENTPFVYEVVERRTPVTSHDTEGNPNPEYPEGIQQRALDREAYQATQREIRSNMDPARLGESPSAVEGAPILRMEDDVVLGGKQRMAALQSLEIGSDADETYQNWLWQHAEEFGIPQTELENFEQPTLVRRLTRALTSDEEQEFGPNTDVSPSMEMSPSERAQLDARRLSPAVLEHLDISESGSLNTEGNLPFIRAFMAKLPRTERGRLVTDNGFLNSDGLRRVQNAILTRAYNVGKELHPAIARMFESTDEKVKTIQHALLRAAPEFALYRGDVDAGSLEMVDVMTPLMDGASTVSALRNNKRTIQDWIDQADLGGKDRDLEKVMHLYRENTTVPDLTDALRYVATVLTNLPRKEAGDLLPREKAPTPGQVFDMARDPDALEIDEDGEQRIADTIRELDAEIRQARSVGDFEKANRLEQQRKILTDEEPPC